MLSKNLQQVGQSANHYGKLLNIRFPVQSLFYVGQLHVIIKAVLTIFNFWQFLKQIHPLSHFLMVKYSKIYSNEGVKQVDGENLKSPFLTHKSDL